MPALHALLLLLLLLCAAASAAAAPADRDMQRYLANRQQAIRFQCREPQPRALLSANLTGAGPFEHVDPPYAVLHRCDGGAGCCSSSTVCGVMRSEQVTLVFAVTDRVRGDGTVQFREVTQTNHTQCECVDREPQPPK